MPDSKSYIQILIDSLTAKCRLLDEIQRENARQYDAIRKEPMDEEVFEDTIEKKQKCLEELQRMDEGFQRIYEKVREVLQDQKDAYREEITTLQEWIRRLTEQSLKVEQEEQRNKDVFENQMNALRRKGRSLKTANKVAQGYYQSMNQLNVVDPQFMDKKK